MEDVTSLWILFPWSRDVNRIIDEVARSQEENASLMILLRHAAVLQHQWCSPPRLAHIMFVSDFHWSLSLDGRGTGRIPSDSES